MKRCTEEVEVVEYSNPKNNEDGDTKVEDVKKNINKMVRFRHDNRMVGTSPWRYTDFECLQFCKEIKAPVLVLLATNPV